MEMAANMTAAQEYYVFVPLRGGHLSCHYFSICLLYTSDAADE